MTDITLADIERAVQTTATTVLKNEHYFSDLDGLAGDGDFGTSLATGFRVIDADLPTIDKSAIGSKGKETVTLTELAEMVGAAVDGIMARGGAKLGDKTLLDALIPVREKLDAHATAGTTDLQQVLKECADEAEKAIDATRGLI